MSDMSDILGGINSTLWDQDFIARRHESTLQTDISTSNVDPDEMSQNTTSCRGRVVTNAVRDCDPTQLLYKNWQ